MKTTQPTDADQAFHHDVMELIQKHLQPNTPERVLAISAYIVGQCWAMQNQRTMDNNKCWEVILLNMKLGNIDTVKQFLNQHSNKRPI